MSTTGWLRCSAATCSTWKPVMISSLSVQNGGRGARRCRVTFVPTTTCSHRLRVNRSTTTSAASATHMTVTTTSTMTATRQDTERWLLATSSTAGRTRHKATLATNERNTSNITSEIPTTNHQSFGEWMEVLLRKPRTVPIPRWITPRHSTITLSEVFGHSSFVLVAVSYAVDDFLLLRCLAVAGSTAMLFFTYFHPHGRPLWLPFKWNALFIAINSYQIGKIFWDRQYAEMLSHELLELRNKSFYLMDPVDYSRLMRLGHIETFQKGDVVVRQGESYREFRLVLKGRLRVLRNGRFSYFLEEANFISESGLHIGLMLPGKIQSCCTVVADEPVRVLTWNRTELVNLMLHDAGIRRAIKAVMSWDVVRKLKAQRILLASGLIEDPEGWTERRNQQTEHRYYAIVHNLLSHPEYLDRYVKVLNKYRMIHHISDETHNKALELAGWTPAEFQAGHKEGRISVGGHDQLEDDDDDVQALRMDWRWYLHDIKLRFFG